MRKGKKPAENADDTSTHQDGSITKQDRLERLKLLKQKMNESEKANRQAVIAEHQRKAVNPGLETRIDRKRKEAELLQEELEAKKKGVDLERLRNLNYTAEEVEQWQKKQSLKKDRMNNDFVDWNVSNMRKQEKLFDKLKPNLSAYEESKATATSREVLDIGHLVNHQPTPEQVMRVVEDLNEQTESKAKRSRIRREDPSADITFINEGNKRFNEKIARVYGKYTEEIKESFERGTAL